MRKIAVINYKGGTGKTATAVSLSHGLSKRGKRVLLVDLDPQGSVAYHLGLNPEKTLYDVLISGEDIRDCMIMARPKLDVLASNEHLFAAEIGMAKMKNREQLLSQVLDISGYDFLIMDCGPSINLLNQNALMFADEIMMPVSMEYLALLGVKQLLKNIQIINKLFGREIFISKIIPTFFDLRNKKSKDVLSSLQRVFPSIVSSPIRVCVKLSEAPGSRQTVFEYDDRSKGAQDYLKLVKEVLDDGKK
jgi:chromosome partitioning protein